MYVTGAPCRGVTVPRSLPSCAGGVPPREVQAGAGSPGPGGGRGEAAQRHGLGGLRMEAVARLSCCYELFGNMIIKREIGNREKLKNGLSFSYYACVGPWEAQASSEIA